MPKIQLSALATDIKGKSGGSVFSTNQGGTYFRNAPSGGGKKTQHWNLRKSQFAQVSSHYRSLSEDQRETWNLAAPSFPTQNAFGSPRIPSGFELFMRLNGVLVSHNFPLLSTAPSPEAFPLIGEIEWNANDNFALVAQKAVLLNNVIREGRLSYAVFNAAASDIQFENGFAISFRYSMKPSSYAQLNPGGYSCLFSLGAESVSNIKVIFESINIHKHNILVVLQIASSTFTNVYTVTGPIENSIFSLGLYVNTTDFAESVLRINNQIISPKSTQSRVFDEIEFNPQVSLGLDSSEEMIPFLMSDFRMFLQSVSHQTWSFICNGYEVNLTPFWFGLTDDGLSGTKNQGSTLSSETLTFPNNEESPVIFQNFPQVFVPRIWIDFLDALPSNIKVAISCTAPFPAAQRRNQNRVRLLGTLSVLDPTEVDITEFFASVWGSASSNSSIELTLRLINSNTGQITEAPVKPKKPIVRFKPAADLSGKL